MAAADTDVWTCPACEETVRGSRQHRSFTRGVHARRHGTTRAELNTGGLLRTKTRTPGKAGELVIPPAPKIRRRTR